MKRPRAPIACFRCHRKKVRCDGAHPFCTRCQSTGSSCSYPSSRRSRNTQHHHVDPYIDHLSQLEHQIRQIEVDMNEYRSMLLSSLMTTSMDPASSNNSVTTTIPNGQHQPHPQEDMLRSHLSKTEQEVQESRTILAQLRLRGEQRIARTKRNQTKEAKQQQQRQQQRSTSSVHPSNDDKKKTTSRAASTINRLRKSESTTTSNEIVSSSSYIGSNIHESSSATKTVNHKPDVKSSSSSSSLQHVPANFISMDLYGQSLSTSSSTSYHDIYRPPPHHNHHHHQHTSSGGYPMPLSPPPQQQSTDLYYMTMVGSSTSTGTSSAYYDPLIDYPWTTPTDFAATTTGVHDNNKPVTTTSSTTNTPITISSMENEIKTEQVHHESAHYSPSTVAAIEQVTRMAQQMDHPHHQ